LKAIDLIQNRPDTLHRRLLAQHLLRIISQATDPLPVSTLYSLSPHSSPFQIQRALNDLLNMGQINRPARGFYALAPAHPVFPSKPPATTKLDPTAATKLDPTAATTPKPTDTPIPKPPATTKLDQTAATKLDPTATITLT
jgi:hypothetical protein